MKKITLFKKLEFIIKSKFNIQDENESDSDIQDVDQERTSKKQEPDFKPFDLDTIFSY